MLLLVGLGNPGQGYARHRHNIGFMAVDEIVRRHGFSPWRPRFDGETAEGQVDGVKVLAVKPMTYMNNSGHAVAAAARFFKVPEARTIVIHDEIELAPGKLRIKQGGGHAGHNGLKSIDAQFGQDYWRVRLGVGRPDRAITDMDPDAVADYVLHDFAKADKTWLEPMIDAVADNFPLLVAGEHGRFQNKVALAVNPPPPKPQKSPIER